MQGNSASKQLGLYYCVPVLLGKLQEHGTDSGQRLPLRYLRFQAANGAAIVINKRVTCHQMHELFVPSLDTLKNKIVTAKLQEYISKTWNLNYFSESKSLYVIWIFMADL